MKRLIILCLTLITFVVVAEDKVIEQQGQWSIIEQSHRANPSNLFIFENDSIKLLLACNPTYKRALFSIFYFDVKELVGISQSSHILVRMISGDAQMLPGFMFNYAKDSVTISDYTYYAGSSKGYNKEKAKLLPILSQLFKQFLTASGDITFTAQGEGDTVYQATISSDGLPTMFNHFAQYCGPDFIEAFDLKMKANG